MDNKAIERELKKLRAEQTRLVMPLIGTLLDAWDGLPNDMKGDIEDASPSLSEAIEAIRAAMEDE